MTSQSISIQNEARVLLSLSPPYLSINCVFTDTKLTHLEGDFRQIVEFYQASLESFKAFLSRI